MQLFTIGLELLNQDGTRQLDDAGEPKPTYSNDDVANFARGWTNLHHQGVNTKLNSEFDFMFDWRFNKIDPMWLPSSNARDVFPKTSLLVDGKRGYIGDKVPRCDAMPSRPWLRKGAVYQFRKSAQTEMGKQDVDWATKEWVNWPRMVLDPATSSLYAKLCNANELGECQFKSTVVLDEDLPCDGTCQARSLPWDGVGFQMPCECSIDEPRTVKVDNSKAPVWYEYVRLPCISLAYPEIGNMNTVKHHSKSGDRRRAMCADSRLPVAGTVCCDADGLRVTNICTFKSERTTYATTQERCEVYGEGFQVCAWDERPNSSNCGNVG